MIYLIDDNDVEKMLSTMYGNDWKNMYKRKGQKLRDQKSNPKNVKI